MNMFRIAFVLLLASNLYALAESAYLPLVEGKRWVLRSGSNRMSMEVVGRENDTYRVRWDNPWIAAEFKLRPVGGKIYLTGLAMNGQTVPMPQDTVYWDFEAREGEKYASAIGNFAVITRTKQVNGYRNCVQIRETNKQGQQLFWTFAPGIGFVQFGEGRGAFVLESSPNSGEGSNPVSSRQAEPSMNENSNPVSSRRGESIQPQLTNKRGPVWIGLAANPAANEGYNPTTVKHRFEQSLHAGVSYFYLSPKWNEIETGKRKYKLNDVDFQIKQSADYNIPAVFHLRIIDTNQRSMPADLMNKSFRDPEVRERLFAALDTVMDHMRGRVQYMLLGNEIEGYFRAHKNEVSEYAELYAAAARHIKERFGGMPVSLSIGFDGLEVRDLLRPLLDQTDFFAVTYYGLTPDFIVKDPNRVHGDITRIVEAAEQKQVLLQEVGYPSSEVNNSSEEKQARFFSNVLDELRNRNSKFIGANFCFMSDFSDELADGFVKYYKAGNASRFRFFLKTLGMFDDQGRPKRSWELFQQKAPQISGRRG